jgi:hypothetical protein
MQALDDLHFQALVPLSVLFIAFAAALDRLQIGV